MKLALVLALIWIAVALKLSEAATLENPTVGNNWHLPTSTGSSTGVAKAASQYYNYRTVSNENSPSSFLPTTANAANPDPRQILKNAVGMGENPQPNYQGSTGKQFNQYYQYQPDTNSYAVFPGTSHPAEQRQEFLDPNLLPLGVGGPGSGPGPGDFGGDGGGGSFFDNLPSIGGITSGIGGTASNIAQSVGLGGLGVAGSFIVLAIGGPLLAFAIIFPVAILIVAILGFPVLQLTLPPSDPNLARKIKGGIMDTARKAREVLQSEECVERLSCSLARKSRKLPYESWILQKMDNVTNVWANRVAKSVKTGRADKTATNSNAQWQLD